jgi:hypothetical protein
MSTFWVRNSWKKNNNTDIYVLYRGIKNVRNGKYVNVNNFSQFLISIKLNQMFKAKNKNAP